MKKENFFVGDTTAKTETFVRELLSNRVKANTLLTSVICLLSSTSV